MTKYRYRFLGTSLLLLILTLFSCRKDKDQNTNLILTNLIDEFQISLLESLSPNGKQLVMRVKTLEEVDCENAALDYSLEQSTGKIVISINEIDLPSNQDCISNPMFLTTDIPLGSIPDGSTDLEVNLRESVHNEGTLHNEDSHYRISLRTQHGIDLPYKKLFKIQEGTIWGYIGYRTEISPVVDQFFSDLTQLTAEGDYEQGNYGHFTYDKSAEETISFEDNHELPFVSRFLLKLTSDKDELVNLIEQYRQQYGSEIELEIRTWKGEVY